jgi:hypothetical protein
VVVVAALIAGGCGRDEPLRALAPVGAAGWSVDRLTAAVDGQTAVTYVTTDEVVVLTVTEAGRLRAWRSHRGRRFAPMAVEAPPVEGLYLIDVVVRGEQAVAIASTVGDRRPRVFSSTARGPWLEVVTSGLEGPALAEDIVQTDDRFVIVGSRGRSGPGPGAAGTNVSVAWTSADARTWTATDLPFGTAAGASGVTAIGSDLIAVGPGAPKGLVWRSSDGGRTWPLVPAQVDGVGAGFRLHDIATARGVVVAIGSELDQPLASSVVVRSIDGGRTWARAEGAGGLDTGRHPARLTAGASGFTIATSRANGASVVLRSANGDMWSELLLTAVRGLARVDDVAAHPSGWMVLFGRSRAGSWSAWSWPSSEVPPPVR